MAIINPPAVAPGDDTEANWANKVVTHVVATFATTAERDQQIPSPTQGRVVYLESSKELQIWDGTEWASGGFVKITGDTMTGDLTLGEDSETGEVAYRMKRILGGDLYSYALLFSTAGGKHSLIYQYSVNGTPAWTTMLNEDGFSVLSGNQSGDLRFKVGSGSIDLYRITKAHTNFYIDPISDSSNPANVYIQPSTGRFFHSTSARKFKKHIKAAPELADLELTPVTFTSRHDDDDDSKHIGFIADDLPDDRAIMFDKHGEVNAYDLQAVVAILAAKVNRLEEQLAALEEAT